MTTDQRHDIRFSISAIYGIQCRDPQKSLKLTICERGAGHLDIARLWHVLSKRILQIEPVDHGLGHCDER